MFPNGTEKGGGGGLKLGRTETLTVVRSTMRQSHLSHSIENIEMYIAIQPKNIGISYFAHIVQP